MPDFNYTARDSVTGKKMKGTIAADSVGSVKEIVKGQGLAILSVRPKGNVNILDSFFRKIKSQDKVIFSRQLSTLINAGLPLSQSLRSVTNQTKNPALQAILTKVISDVEGGKSFSAALEQHPTVFDRVFVSLVAAGEASGTLDSSLERIATQQEKDAELASKVKGAMIYPVIVLLVMAGVVTFMLVSVLPQVQELYDGLPGAKLPFVTVMLLAISDFIIGYWWVIIALIGIGIAMTSRWAKTLGGRQIIDKAKLAMWPISGLFRRMYMARFARTSSTLVSSGVPLIQVLEIVRNAVNNVHVESSISKAIEKVKGGKALSASLMNDENFIDLVPNMIKIGEDSGSLQTMLEKTADYFEKEVDDQVKAISTIIEPVLMIILGVVAITIVAAILIPIYGLVGQNVLRLHIKVICFTINSMGTRINLKGEIMKRKNNQSGFTIIEVMIVLAIAGLIMVVVLIAIPQLQRNQRNSAREAVMARISTEIGNYAGRNNGRIPDSTDMEGFVERYLSTINIEDPTTGAPMFTVQSYIDQPNLGTDDIPELKETDDLGDAKYAPGYECNGEEIIRAGNRDFALYTVLEGGAIYCVDNS